MDSLSAQVAQQFGPFASIDRATLAALCVKHGQTLNLKTLDGARVLWALAGNESSFGADCNPRHEYGYCIGLYSHTPQIVALTAKYGHGAHCSYGPWQILLADCADGISPRDMADPNVCIGQVVANMLRLLRNHPDPTLAQVGQFWNGGHVGADNTGVRAYCAELAINYARSMPVPVPAEAAPCV